MRRAVSAFLILAGLLLLALAALWLLRLPLAEWGLSRLLATRGLSGSAQVARLDLDRAELQAVELEGQRASRIVVAYDLAALLAEGRIGGLEVEGMRLAHDPATEDVFARLADAFGGDGADDPRDAALPVLPPLALQDAEIALETPRGPLRLRLQGGLAAAADLPGPDRRLDLAVETREGPVRLVGRAEGLYRPGNGDGSRLSLSLAGSDGPPLKLQAQAAIAAGRLGMDVEVEGDAPLLAGLAALPAELRPVSGRVALQGRLEAAAAPLLDGAVDTLLDAAGGLQALEGRFRLQEAELPGRAAGLGLQGGIALARDAAGPGLALQPVAVEFAALDADWLAGLGLPGPLAGLLAAGGSLSLAPEGAGPLALVRQGAGGTSLHLDLRATLHPGAGGSLSATAAGDLALPASGAATGRLAGALSLQQLALPGLAALQAGSTAYALSLQPELSLSLTAPLELHGLQAAEALAADLPEAWREATRQALDLQLVPAPGVALRAAADGSLHLALPERLLLQAGGAELEAALEGSLVLPPDGRPPAFDLTLSALTARDWPVPQGRLRALSLSGTAQGDAGAGRAALQASAQIDGLVLPELGRADLEAELAPALHWSGAELSAELQQPGRLLLSPTDGGLSVARRLDLRIDTASLAQGADGLALQAEAALPEVRLALDGGAALAAERLALELSVPPDGAEPAGRLRGEGVALRLDEAGLALRDGRLELGFGGAETRLELAAARLEPVGQGPPLPPLSLSGSARLQDGAVRFSAHGQGLQGALHAAVQGRYELAQGRGQARVELQPLEFVPGGLQPGDLHPALAELGRASGRVSATADLALGPVFAGTARIGLQDVGFTVAGTTIAGLDLDLALDALDPPASPPGQPFSIARIDFGAALTDLHGSLRLRPADGMSELVIETAEAAFLDGRVRLQDAVFDPGRSHYALELDLQGLDLQQLLALAEIDGVSGSGRLSGRVPVVIDDGLVSVSGGALDAPEPGVVAFRSDEARQALAQGGEPVDLMLQALEDFHYRVLRLTVDKPPEGESRVFLRLEGANPAVLDAQPFIFNINLTGNAAPLLAALAQGTEISDRLVQQLLQERQRRAR